MNYFQASDTAELFFDDVRLPKEAILNGEEGLNKGFHFLMHDLGRERIMVAVSYVLKNRIKINVIFSAAISIEAMYELAREKMKNDEIDGVPRVKQQVLIFYTIWRVNLVSGFRKSVIGWPS